MKIGAIIPANREITLNAGKNTVEIMVSNLSDRPIQVGSHYHFFEVNRYLNFDRAKSYGYHLDIPSGTSVRFEPGEEKTVVLTSLGGSKRVYGFNDLTCGHISNGTKAAALETAQKRNFIQGGGSGNEC